MPNTPVVFQYGTVNPSPTNPGNATTADSSIKVNGAMLRMATFSVTYVAAGSGITNTATGTATGGVVNATPSIVGTGTSYVVGDIVSIAGGTNAATLRVTGQSSGNITSWVLLQGGTGYGATFTTQALTERAQFIVTPKQTSGWSWNSSGVVNTASGYVSPNTLANGGSPVITGAGGKAVTYQVSDLATGKQISVTTSETVTQILSINHTSDAATSVSKNYWYSGFVSGGAMIINLYTTANSVPAAWTGLTAGTPVYFNVAYLVGGAA